MDIRDLIDSTISDVSLGLVGRSAVYCLGSLLCGWAFNIYNRQIGLALSLVGCGLGIVVVPHLRTAMGWFLAQALVGFSAAGVDVAGNAWLLELWKQDSNPYIQVMHFSYALGSTLAPLICEPFLSPDKNSTQILTNASTIDFFNVTDTSMLSRIYVPYSIVTVVLFIAAAVQFGLYWTSPYKGALRTIGKESRHELTATDSEVSNLLPMALPRSYYLAVVILGGLILCFEATVEQNTFNYLQAFAVHTDLKLTKSKGAFMISALSASFTLFRLFGILFATHFSTLSMLYFNFTIILISNVIIKIYANTNETGLWIGLILLGLGCSSSFPGIYAFLEERINVTNTG